MNHPWKKSKKRPNNLRSNMEGGTGRAPGRLDAAFSAIERVNKTLEPAHFYIHLKNRMARAHDGHIELKTEGTWWRPVAKYRGNHADIRNTARREIALCVGEQEDPMYEDHPFVLRYEKFLIECARDSKKRQFFRSFARRYPDLVNADSRILTPEIEASAARCFEECRRGLWIDEELEKLMLVHSWHSKPGYGAYPNACKVWMVLVIMWMIDMRK